MAATEVNHLIGLLGRIDKLLWPIRDRSDIRRVAAIEQARRQYFETGLPMPRDRGDGAKRKKLERLFDRLESKGLVVFSYANGQRVGRRLPDTIDWQLRSAATWGDSFAEMHTLLIAAKAHQDVGSGNEGYAAEWSLGLGDDWQTGFDADGNWTKWAADRLRQVEEIASPALCRGLLESSSDLDGAAGYRVTTAGLDFLRNPTQPEIDLPEYTSRNCDVYWDAVLQADRDMAGWTSTTPEIPSRLSCGNWGDEDEPPTGIPSIFCGHLRASLADVRTPRGMQAAIRKAIKNKSQTAPAGEPAVSRDETNLPADERYSLQ